ncbi:MAG TPA: PaaI family thioesterase [Gemmatales bacterium]|nr:PaaI family thioesterase [Gemmatales bacterium]
MPDMLALGKQILASQPFSLIFKTEITRFEIGIVELKIPITRELQQQHGFLHGGVLSYAADNALTFAAGSAMMAPVVTSEFKINYVRPAIGEMLIARANVVYSGKTQAVSRCELYVVKDGVEKLCAVAQGTIVRIGQESK